ncbi:hypothetical protein EJB05_30770, partial [Eragrostis curvula]
MRRGGGGGGGRRLPKSSLAPSSAAEATPALDPICRNLDFAFNRRDSDANSICSNRPPSSVGVGATPAAAVPNFSDRATQAAALREVNAFLAPAVTLRPPLPAARDILAAFRHLLERLDYPLQEKEVSFEEDLLFVLRMLSCPFKLTRSALKAPGTPHSWPPLLSVLHWLTLLASVSGDATSSAPFNDLTRYTTQGYSYFIMGDDDAVAALDNEYVNKARSHAEEAVEATRALEKEAQELEEKRNKLTSGLSRREALEADKAALTEDVQKFDAVVKTWSAKVSEKEEASVNLRKELEAVNVRDVDRMHREMQLVEQDIANLENEKAALEDKGWEVDAALVKKLEELDGITEQCNQALKRLKPSIDFQYALNAKGSSPAEVLGLSYKTELKPALKAYAEENRRISASKLDESVELQKQLQEKAKMLEEKKNNISSWQNKTDEMVARLNSLDREIENDDSRCTADARQMKNELERKEHLLSTVEKEADEFLKNAEQRFQDAVLKADEETQACANELLQLMDSVADYREFMEAAIAQRKKELNETADYIASLPSKTSSQTSDK